MTETAETTPDPESIDQPTAADDDEATEDEGVFDDLDWPAMRHKLGVSAIGLLALLAAWALFRVYLSTGEAISIWVSPDFVPIFDAAFNAIVVVAAIAGILLVRRDLS